MHRAQLSAAQTAIFELGLATSGVGGANNLSSWEKLVVFEKTREILTSQLVAFAKIRGFCQWSVVGGTALVVPPTLRLGDLA
jgi:hypothetical protein